MFIVANTSPSTHPAANMFAPQSTPSPATTRKPPLATLPQAVFQWKERKEKKKEWKGAMRA